MQTVEGEDFGKLSGHAGRRDLVRDVKGVIGQGALLSSGPGFVAAVVVITVFVLVVVLDIGVLLVGPGKVVHGKLHHVHALVHANHVKHGRRVELGDGGSQQIKGDVSGPTSNVQDELLRSGG